MGKQRQKKNTGTERTQSANSIDWELQARELVRAGLCSPLILDHRGRPDDRRTQ